MPRVPTVVLTADKPYRTDLLPPEVAQGDTLVSFTEWPAAQELLATASGADHITRTNSGHNIYLCSPALVVDAVQEVVAAGRSGTGTAQAAITPPPRPPVELLQPVGWPGKAPNMRPVDAATAADWHGKAEAAPAGP